MKANAGFGPMMVFLFASPLLNPLIIGLMFATFGIKITVFYFIAAMSVSIIAGYVLEKLGFEKYIKPSQENAKEASCCGPKEEIKEEASCCGPKPQEVLAKESCCEPEIASVEANGSCYTTTVKPSIKIESKWKKIWNLAWGDFKDALLYLLLGIAIGSLIYGFIPT